MLKTVEAILAILILLSVLFSLNFLESPKSPFKLEEVVLPPVHDGNYHIVSGSNLPLEEYNEVLFSVAKDFGYVSCFEISISLPITDMNGDGISEFPDLSSILVLHNNRTIRYEIVALEPLEKEIYVDMWLCPEGAMRGGDTLEILWQTV